MRSIGDEMLAAGVLPNLEAIHGEGIQVLSGLDAGLTFTGIVEIDEDSIIEGQALGEDRRGRRLVRFACTPLPRIHNQDRLKTVNDGKKWKATRMPGNSHLTVDYELVLVDPKDS